MPTHPLRIVTFLPLIRLVRFLEYSGHILGLGQYYAPIFFLLLFSMCLTLVRSYHLPIDFIFSSSHRHDLPMYFETWQRKNSTTYELCIRYARYDEICGAYNISERTKYFIRCQNLICEWETTDIDFFLLSNKLN